MHKLRVLLSLLLLTGCAGLNRSCSSWWASTVGADWLVVQFDYSGKVFNCWKLRNASVVNEQQSDGIHWQDTMNGNIVHIAGWYNWIQVSNGNFDAAAATAGVDANACHEGHYQSVAGK